MRYFFYTLSFFIANSFELRLCVSHGSLNWDFVLWFIMFSDRELLRCKTTGNYFEDLVLYLKQMWSGLNRTANKCLSVHSTHTAGTFSLCGLQWPFAFIRLNRSIIPSIYLLNRRGNMKKLGHKILTKIN